jgi:hypothetical protein
MAGKSAKTRLARAAVGVALGAVALLATAVGPTRGDAPVRARADRAAHGLKPFASCDPLRAYLRDHRRALASGPVALGASEDSAGTRTGSAPQAEPAGSQTNVQEAGVDEPDLIKSDGETICALAGGRLEAAAAGGPDEGPASLGSLTLPHSADEDASADPQLLLFGDRALVMASSYRGALGPTDAVAAGERYAGASRTLLVEVDVSDPTAMRVLRTMTVDGSLLSPPCRSPSAVTAAPGCRRPSCATVTPALAPARSSSAARRSAAPSASRAPQC